MQASTDGKEVKMGTRDVPEVRKSVAVPYDIYDAVLYALSVRRKWLGQANGAFAYLGGEHFDSGLVCRSLTIVMDGIVFVETRWTGNGLDSTTITSTLGDVSVLYGGVIHTVDFKGVSP